MNKNALPDHARLDALLDCAVRAAQAAGRHALRNVARRTEALQGFAHDVKLKLDAECQAIAERGIRSTYPDHDILGEETAEFAATSTDLDRPQWVIDPIDGTVNFSHGLPFWCCSIAVRLRGRPLAAAVYAPVIRELYTATARTPARCNGTPIRVSGTRTLRGAIIMTGLDKNVDPALPPFEIFRTISTRVQKARVMGSAALDMCWVAAGRADGYFESGIYAWDIAAAQLITRQAGGRADVLSSQGGHRLSFIASNGRIHRALKKLVTTVLPSKT